MNRIDEDALKRLLDTSAEPILPVRREELKYLLAGLDQGRELWALCMKYGLRHRPECPQQPGSMGNYCDCGLTAEVLAVMEKARIPLVADV